MDSSPHRHSPLALVLFVLFAGLTLTYYLVHKPFDPRSALAIGSAIFVCFLAAAVLALAGGLGRRLFSGRGFAPPVRLCVQAGLGLGILGILWLVGAVVGAARPLVGWIVLAAGSIALWREARDWLTEWSSLREVWEEAGLFGKLLGGYLLAVLALTLLAALAPPIEYDALTYHLALPRIYTLVGRLVYVPEIMFWGMPQTGEMLYTWGLQIGGERLPAVLGWGFGVLALTGMLGLARQHFNATAGFLASAALVSGFTLAAALSRAYVDWLAIMFGVAWLAAIMAWTEDMERSILLLSGALAGMAVGTKYTAGILLVCGAAVIFWRLRLRLKKLTAAVSLYGLAGMLTVAPWLIRNLAYTGSPVYPLLFPAGAMTPLRLALYSKGQAYGNWLDMVILPLRATFLGAEGGIGYSASIGPLLFGLAFCAPLAYPALTNRSRLAIKTAAVVSATAVLVWMVTGRFSQYLLQARLYFAFFPALALLACAGWTGLQDINIRGVRLGRLTTALVVLVLGLNLLELGQHIARRGTIATVLGIEAAETYVEKNLGWYARAVSAVKSLPPGSKTLMLWEPRSYSCQMDCDPDEILDRWLQERYDDAGSGGRGENEILARWRASGYTHLLVHHAGVEFVRISADPAYHAEDWLILDRFLRRLDVVQDFNGAYVLYSLQP